MTHPTDPIAKNVAKVTQKASMVDILGPQGENPMATWFFFTLAMENHWQVSANQDPSVAAAMIYEGRNQCPLHVSS